VRTPEISIVLPTRNGAATLPGVLDAISRQRIDRPFEVIAIDSSSDDGTVELLRRRIDQVISIRAADFDHGLTRNLGIERARGELIVLMVQDAEPASDGWLNALTEPLFADDRLAGAFARQRPRGDASPLTRYYLERWLAASSVARTMTLTDGAELEDLDPMARLERCTFDNVCSCIRRSVWRKHPFRRTPIGEDVEWAREVLLAGYRLAYAPAAEVIHSHDRPVRDEFERTYRLHRRLYELFQLRTVPTLPLLVRAIASSVVVHCRLQPLSARAIGLAFAWPIAQYAGASSAIRSANSAKAGRNPAEAGSHDPKVV
jgi:rhamnosyltransferase